MDYTYHPQLSLATAGAFGSPYVQGTAYDAAGRVIQRTLGLQAVQAEYTYYPWTQQGGRLPRLHSFRPGQPGNPAGSVVSMRHTWRDQNGNVLEIEDYVTASPQTQSFTYDALDRLTAAQATGGGLGLYSESYGYDPFTGNLASKGGATYAYGDPLHAHAATALSSGWTYAYAANGNMTLRLQGGTQVQLTYDAENHLTQVSGAYQAQFGYNGDGQRVIAMQGGETRLFIGNYFEWNATTSTSRKYYFAGGARVALRDENNALHWLLSEALGSTSVSAAASTTTGQGYRAWGEARFGSLPTEYQYTGQYRQPEFGLDYFNARWYDPALGRWTQPDTVVPLAQQGGQAWDRYAYVNNNPFGDMYTIILIFGSLMEICQ